MVFGGTDSYFIVLLMDCFGVWKYGVCYFHSWYWIFVLACTGTDNFFFFAIRGLILLGVPLV
jgi:hypothetical protein